MTALPPDPTPPATDAPTASALKAAILEQCEQAWVNRDTQFDRLQEISQQTHDQCTSGPFEHEQFSTGLAASLRNLGYHDLISGRKIDCLHKMLRALSILGVDPQPALRSDLLRCVAFTFLEIGSYAEGLDYAYKALELALEIKDIERQAFVWDAIGSLYGELSRQDKAASAEETALGLYRQAGNRRGEAIILNNIAMIYLALGDKEKALRSADTSRAMAEELGISVLASVAIGTIGEIWMEIGNYDQAARCLDEYYQRSVASDLVSDQALGHFLRGKVEYLRGNYAAARELLEATLQQAEHLNSQRVRADCLKLLSDTCENLDDLKAALVYFREYNAVNAGLFSQATIERISLMQVFHQIETANKDAEIYRLQAISLTNEIERRKEIEQALLYQSTHDSLTGLYNRGYFESELGRLEREKVFPVSLVMLDLDNFKQINDLMGHLAGDQFLSAFATALRKSLRPEDHVARLGGDEFAVLLPNVTADHLYEVVQRMRASLDQLIRSMPLYNTIIDVSIGSAVSDREESMESLYKRSDAAMYVEKAAQRASRAEITGAAG